MEVRHLAPDVEQLIERAISEDLGIGDPTTDLLIPSDLQGTARVLSRADGVLAGIEVGLAVFSRIDANLRTTAVMSDGDPVKDRTVVAEIQGCVASILKGERTALNFMQRLSGIATATAAYVSAVEGHDVRIIDTRKTTPGLRSLEKQAIRAGGGFNHRQNLGDGILIKDNHIEALKATGMSLGEIVRSAHERKSHTINVEVEVEDLEQVEEALKAGASILLLDNMDTEQMAAAVRLCEGKAVTEASGGITFENVRQVAATGVDLISVGALTHSSKALDLSLDLL
ncbi:MAG: carboxylating nicotinate-nucleotide diphosphorylase [Chloroflexi bacterium]|nr:carboxylating nicotinate-nucleotide diphosphorylase [Chloroflexota bacterium]